MAKQIGTEVRRNGGSAEHLCAHPPTRRRADPRRAGQATTEMVIILPLFVLLAGGAACIAYMCHQGLKAQQAANLAARINGQERVLGGVSSASIQTDNGTGLGVGDRISQSLGDAGSDGSISPDAVSEGNAPPMGSVYGRFYKAAKGFFKPGDKVIVPPPTHTGVNTDQVKVVRVMKPPRILNLQLKPVVIEATAYGGEDPRMYGLPRWGSTGNSGQFYQSQIKE